MTKPTRIQLSRRKGFDLQAHSRAVNGLPAVVVARPSRWGNPITKRDFDDVQDILFASGAKPLSGTWQRYAVKWFDAWIGGETLGMGTPPSVESITADLSGKNLACWCRPGQPCHADVLLVLANRPVCDEANP